MERMCGCSGESGDHLLLHCFMAGVLCFNPLGVEWDVSELVVELLFGC